MDFFTNIASNLAYDLLKAGASRFDDKWLGGPEGRALEGLFRDATASMLAELLGSEGGLEDQGLLGVLEYQFGLFFRDPQVAEPLLDVALASRPPPIGTLRERFVTLWFDPDTFLISFDRAMRIFAYHLDEDLREEASRPGSAIHNLVEVSELQAMREMLRDLLERQATIGPDLEELWRESRARCAERWRAVGLSREDSLKLADNPSIGAPDHGMREAPSRPVAIVVGEVVAGKSLLVDRLLQRAIVQLRDDPGAPLPAYIEAWEVTGRLRDTVLEKTSSLGNSRKRGAVICVDGAEESGQAQAHRLLREARILVETWPNTRAVMAGRPLSVLAEQDEMIQMPTLSAEETKTLIERLTGRELRLTYTSAWPQSLKEAAQRPLFATLLGLNFRDRNFRNPRSTGELLSSLVQRALARAEETVELEQLRRLAVASIDSGRGSVRIVDVATTVEAQRLRGTGLVAERNGTVGFSLQILNEWFAAQALEIALVDPRALASDPTRLERWRYPLMITVGTFGYQRVKNILDPIVRAAPAFASQVVEEGLTGRVLSEDVQPPPPLESGRQLRTAMEAWTEGIGLLAPLIAPVRDDGTPAPVAVNTSGAQAWVGWYRGAAELEDVTRLTSEAWLEPRVG